MMIIIKIIIIIIIIIFLFSTNKKYKEAFNNYNQTQERERREEENRNKSITYINVRLNEWNGKNERMQPNKVRKLVELSVDKKKRIRNDFDLRCAFLCVYKIYTRFFSLYILYTRTNLCVR